MTIWLARLNLQMAALPSYSITTDRPDYSAWPTIEFNADLGRLMEVSKKTGLETPVLDDSTDMAGLQLSLDAGDGRLFTDSALTYCHASSYMDSGPCGAAAAAFRRHNKVL